MACRACCVLRLYGCRPISAMPGVVAVVVVTRMAARPTSVRQSLTGLRRLLCYFQVLRCSRRVEPVVR
jgi:hypothetical protein